MGELTVGGRPRGFALSLPRTGSGGIPLVIVLHGNHPDATGQMMREWTTFDEQAGAFGDVAFLRALIDTVAGRHGTHPDRPVPATPAPPSSPAGTPQQAASAGRGSRPGRYSTAGTPGPAPSRSPGPPRPAPQEFDAAEEICRFAEPLLVSADSRRL